MAGNGKTQDLNNSQDKVGAVMVVGGGIAGMQSALNLANAGFKVYLVEEKASIGGRMAQLDKTFPTNDCAMCMISPRLIDVSKHPNIQMLTKAELVSLEGTEGNFKAKVKLAPTYIIPEKCSACGDCVEACPVDLPNEFDQCFNTRKATSKLYPQAIPNKYTISKNARPPCKITCPAGCNGQGYVALISKGKYVEAVNHIKQWIPLPSSLGRICHHPCEAKCNRGELDQPVAIAPLKSFVGDFVRRKRQEGSLPPEPKPEIDLAKPKIAVVGSGPSGLACAYDLIKQGYPVTIFEAGSQPGGQLQSCIPAYRLPKDTLAADIADIIDAGIELKLNTAINDKFGIESLKNQGYQAVYLAIGAQKGRSLPVPGVDLPGVLLSLDFLRDVKAGKATRIGKKVVVVGGGNVAMDVARSARRLGTTDVTAVCLESRDIMPAHAWEIAEAEEEGIAIKPSWGPAKIIAQNGIVSAIEFNKCTSVFDREKKFNPTFDTKTTLHLDCDTVIIAIGQTTDAALRPTEAGVKFNRGGFIQVDLLTLATEEAGVFAGGDAVTGPRSAVEAIAQGHEAATSILRYLKNEDLRQGREKTKEEPAKLPEGKHKPVKRLALKKISLDKRVSGFEELETGYTEEEARKEAERCLDCGLCSECLQCVAVCQAKALDHTMKEKMLDINVGSVILAPGFETFDATLKGEYGYRRMPNVVTSLDFERILSASGPFQGQVVRPSDGKHPKKVAWIQCVGSRDITCGRDYCSSVCCMYATKEAVIAIEHDRNINATIFYNDIRAYGKGFERYYQSAKKNPAIRYIKSIVSAIKEVPGTNNLLMEYTGEDGKKVEEEFDMVVLSVGIVPTDSSKQLAGCLGVATDRFGFAKTDAFETNRSTRPGVYVAGAFEAPMDIPESVMSASSAACLASQGISRARGTMVTEKIYPPEVDTSGQAPRVGVFVCRCGANIARVVAVSDVTAYARNLPNVVYAEDNLYTCSTDTQNRIIKAIKDNNLNRVVVASCSPRTHEPLFQDTIREAGLNRFLFEMANIRDQCSWVHFNDTRGANEKAKDLVRMAVSRAATLQPLQKIPQDISRRALVIGGGLAGMTAALALAAQGFESVLVEKEKELGGNLRRVYKSEDGADPQTLLKSLVLKVKAEPKITVYMGSQVKDFSGFLGNYHTEIVGADGGSHRIDHGVVILATGAAEYRPAEYLYGQSDRVMTQLELEAKLAKGEQSLKPESVVMIQCVGSREEEHNYCSRICCTHAVKNAISLKEANPETEVYILYRDMRTYGLKELDYQQAREKGVIFIRYDETRKPQVSQENGRLAVRVFDTVLGADVELKPDILVLSVAIRPQPDATELATRLKLPLTQDRFFMEAHLKLRPLEFVNDGIYLCGLAHSPKSIPESIAQAQGVVAQALTVLSQEHLMAGGVVSVVNHEKCVACLTCVRSCPFGVPRINSEGVAQIEIAACQGCGICVSACPRKAITLQHYSDAQVLAKSAVLNKV